MGHEPLRLNHRRIVAFAGDPVGAFLPLP